MTEPVADLIIDSQDTFGEFVTVSGRYEEQLHEIITGLVMAAMGEAGEDTGNKILLALRISQFTYSLGSWGRRTWEEACRS